MVEQFVPDDLWVIAQTVIPPQKPRTHPQRTLAGILYILRWGLPWRQLPLALGFGSGQTCERRFSEWRKQGVWTKLLRVILDPPSTTCSTGHALRSTPQVFPPRAAVNIPAPTPRTAASRAARFTYSARAGPPTRRDYLRRECARLTPPRSYRGRRTGRTER
jgi:hypothetical protein